jgi:hypothetical protein
MKWGPKQTAKRRWSKRDLAGVARDLHAMANEHAYRAKGLRASLQRWRAGALAAGAVALAGWGAAAWAALR